MPACSKRTHKATTHLLHKVGKLIGTATGFLNRRHIISGPNIYCLSLRQCCWVIPDIKCFPAHDVIDLGQNLSEGALDIEGLEGRRLHEKNVLSFSETLGIVYGNST